MIRPSAVVIAAAILVSAGAVALAGREPEPLPSPERSATEVATSKATLACPESSQGSKSETTLFAVSPQSSDAGSSDPGTITAATLDSESPQVIGEIAEPGQALKMKLSPDSDAVPIVTGDGAMSAGLAASQWTVQSSKSVSGIAASACLAGADSWWFSGVSTAVGATTRLILTNPTPAVAIADLHFYDVDGLVKTVGERGIAIAPQSRQLIDLARFAPGRDAMTVNVETTTGRVVAALHTELTTGITPGGTEWVPPSSAPSTEVLVNAGFAGSDSQTLQISNPGDREALVEVQVVGASGAFVPSGLDDLRIGPGAVKTKDLTTILDKDAAAILLTSTAPVTGAVVSSDTKPADISITAPSSPLTTPAVVPAIPDTDLVVAFASTTRKAGQVTIEGFGGEGKSVSTDTVNLTGQTTTTWSPPKKSDAVYFVVTVAVDGAAQAVAQYSSPDGTAALPVISGSTTVTRPDVRPSR